MGGIPKEPRQQMINMMYLVLTALLAMNISAEILKAFELVNEGIGNTITAIEKKNKWTMDAIAAQHENDPEKAEKAYKLSKQAKQYANELTGYIDELEGRIVKLSGGINEEGEISGAKNQDIPSQVMIFEKKGKELQEKINETREKFLNIVKMASPENLAKDNVDNFRNVISLKAEDPPPHPEKGNISWAASQFEMVPVIAAITLLTKYKNDVKSTEAEILNFLLSSIGATDFKFDVLEAKVIAPTSYVTVGQEYQAEIFVSAFSSTQNPTVILGEIDSTGNVYGDTTHVPVENGKGMLKKTAAGPGIKNYGGVIQIQGPTGENQYYPFKSEYQVAEATAVVSPDKMNVLYIGVDNPISISVPGFPVENIVPNMSQGSLSKKGGGAFIAKVVKPGDAKINVSVKLDENKTKQMGVKEFRVKRVPDPIAQIAGQSGGKIKAGTFKAQRGMMAVLKDFVFDLRFEIIGFEMIFAAKRADLITDKSRGPLFTDKMLQFLKTAKPGDMVYFDGIKARGPDGTTRKLPSIAFQLI